MLNKILVTGCAGFIGSHLCEHLLQSGFKVVGMDSFSENYPKVIKERNLKGCIGHANFSFFEANIEVASDYEQITEDIDLVIHLAARSGVRPSLNDPLAFYQTNVLGTLTLLEEMKKRQIKKILFASSSSVYGDNLDRKALNEETALKPISPYGLSKKQGEELLQLYHESFGFSALCLRLFTVYGPRQRPDLAIHHFFNQIKKQETISLFGKGDTARDYTYIEDIIQGFVQAIEYLTTEEKVFEILNLGSHAPVLLKDMVNSIQKAAGSEAEIMHLPENKGDVNYTHADIQKAKSLLNYAPQFSFQEGVNAFYKWFKHES